jgi:hypothetical protein
MNPYLSPAIKMHNAFRLMRLPREIYEECSLSLDITTFEKALCISTAAVQQQSSFAHGDRCSANKDPKVNIVVFIHSLSCLCFDSGLERHLTEFCKIYNFEMAKE